MFYMATGRRPGLVYSNARYTEQPILYSKRLECGEAINDSQSLARLNAVFGATK